MSTNVKEISEELKRELEIFQVLKPYIGHCLTLNHDLNNPLAGIIGYCEFLQEEAECLTEEQKGYLRQIATCAERMHKLIEDLCIEKISLDEKIDLKSVEESYQKIKKLD